MKHHYYTNEEKTWLIEQDPNLTYSELTDRFNKHFGTSLKKTSIQDLMCKRLKAVSRKHNMKKTQFKGEAIGYHYPIGAEIEKAGYIWVKVNDVRFHKKQTYKEYEQNWRRKSDIVWEEAYGKLADSQFLIFLDGDKTNCDLNNLYPVTRAMHARMSQNHWHEIEDIELKLCALKCCELMSEISNKRKETKK